MALTKQNLNINFSQGLDTKTDPFQVSPGKFLSLSNTIFTKGGLLQKRFGYDELVAATGNVDYTTTYNGNLIVTGADLQAYSSGAGKWVNKGALQPIKLSTLPLVRSSTAQTQADAAVASNGLVCSAYTDQIPSGGANVPTYKYAVVDSTTGQNIINSTSIPGATSPPRAFQIGKYFLVVYGAASNNLKYIAINTVTLVVTAPSTIATDYLPGSTIGFNGIVANNSLYLTWNGTDGGGALHMSYIDSTLTQHNTVPFAGSVGTLISMAADETQPTPIIWVVFYNSATSNGYALATDAQLITILAPTQIISNQTVNHLACAAQNNVLTALYEVENFYNYSGGAQTDYIDTVTITLAGAVGGPSTVSRSVGLASKAFVINEVIYVLATYGSTLQPTYFLINLSGDIVSELAYSNGGGYASAGLPYANVSGNTVKIAYLFKDLIQAVNRSQGAASSSSVYSQTGINLATFTLTTSDVVTSEVGGNLHLSGGYLIMYDGAAPVEHGFFVWPDDVVVTGASATGNMAPQEYFYQVTYEWADNQGNTHRSAPSIPQSVTIVEAPANFTGDLTTSSPVVLNVSDTTDLQVGQPVSGTGIPADTYILSIDSSTQITLSADATATNTSVTITPTTVQSIAVNIPTLRLTSKELVKLVVYRWSTGQQSFFQTTNLLVPTINDKSVDSIAFIDTNADEDILGNNLIYTTGGVIENIVAPANDTMTLFKSRLFLVDAEDKNLLWYSKQVIENTPVEMSDLFTIYVAPTIGAQGNTGPLSALAAMDDKLILFKADAIYYIAGDGPDNTGANSTLTEPQFITATVGCADQHSIVMTPDGLMFQSDKGIWLLDRSLQTHYIGAPVEKYNNNVVLSALTVPGTNQVRFTLDNGVTLMYDYFWKQWGTFTNIPGISSVLYQGKHTFINSFGKVFQESESSYLDGSSPVLMSFTTGWINLMGLQGLERAYFFYILGSYISPHKLSLGIAYDYSPAPAQTVMITPDNNSGVWGSETLWGGGEVWGGPGSLEQWRIFFAQQKCQSFQITLNEIFDHSIGKPAGAGLTMSGINLVVGAKRTFSTLKTSRSAG